MMEDKENEDGMTRLYEIKRDVLTRDLEAIDHAIRFDVESLPSVCKKF
jgi:hypothetical protein